MGGFFTGRGVGFGAGVGCGFGLGVGFGGAPIVEGGPLGMGGGCGVGVGIGWGAGVGWGAKYVDPRAEDFSAARPELADGPDAGLPAKLFSPLVAFLKGGRHPAAKQPSP